MSSREKRVLVWLAIMIVSGLYAYALAYFATHSMMGE